MALINNRTPLLSNIKFCASFHHHMWIQTGVMVRKRLRWVLTSVILTFDLWPWLYAWTSLWSLLIIHDTFMMIRWWKHSPKCVTGGPTDRQTENTNHRAAWSELKILLTVFSQIIWPRYLIFHIITYSSVWWNILFFPFVAVITTNFIIS